jgi:hypothetical protein
VAPSVKYQAVMLILSRARMSKPYLHVVLGYVHKRGHESEAIGDFTCMLQMQDQDDLTFDTMMLNAMHD